MPDAALKSEGREVRERLARCVSTMVFYQSDGWSWQASGLLSCEVEALSAWAGRLSRDDSLLSTILDPLRAEMIVRFGETTGVKLHREFLRAYREATEDRPADKEPAQARHFRPRAV